MEKLREEGLLEIKQNTLDFILYKIRNEDLYISLVKIHYLKKLYNSDIVFRRRCSGKIHILLEISFEEFLEKVTDSNLKNKFLFNLDLINDYR